MTYIFSFFGLSLLVYFTVLFEPYLEYTSSGVGFYSLGFNMKTSYSACQNLKSIYLPVK